MKPGGETNTLPAKRSKRPCLHRQLKNKKNVISSETETYIRIETLTSNSNRTLISHKRQNKSHNSRSQKRTNKSSKHRCNRRKWTYSTRDVSNYTDKVVVVSYNILAVDNVVKHPDLYRGVSSKYLDWEYRRNLLCKEIKRYRPSILCFQEVDKFDDLNDLLGKDGFIGRHKTRSGEACDGCSIFWKSELFTLLHEENIEFQSFGLRNNVAQFCVLKMNNKLSRADSTSHSTCATASHSLLVGNTHVLFNPRRGDVKLGQIRIFLEKAYELSQKWGGIPVVLAGDLNSLPQSAMYQFLASSKLNIRKHDRRQISGQICPFEYPKYGSWSNYGNRPSMHWWTDEERSLATGSRGDHMSHQLQISSAYAEIPGSSKFRDEVGEPQATSHHCMFTGTVDYIWHTPDLVPVKVLETLPVSSLKKTGSLPSKNWGSDHLALVCEFAFADDRDPA